MELGKITPRHQKFIEAISNSPIHIIATMRGKDQYEMVKDEKTGKSAVQKLGVGAKQRDGFEYEFTCTFLIDQKTNAAETQKDNTHIFEGQGSTILTEKHGEEIIKWANSGEKRTPKKPVVKQAVPKTVEELQKAIIAKATELGGSSNKELLDTFQDILGTKNPNSCKDKEKLQKLYEKLGENK